jgi:hypothetical protein
MTQEQTNVAASFNLYTAENLPATHKEYFNNHFLGSYKEKRAKELESIALAFSFKLYYECTQDTNHQGEVTYYIEHTYWIKESENGTLCMLGSNKGKFYLHPYYGHERGLNYVQKGEYFNMPQEPNKIGVFSEKKVNDWVKYCDEYVQAIKEAKQRLEAKNKEASNAIESFIASLNNPSVSRYSNRVSVETDLFRVVFELYESGYLSKKIEFKGGLNDIAKICQLG